MRNYIQYAFHGWNNVSVRGKTFLLSNILLTCILLTEKPHILVTFLCCIDRFKLINLLTDNEFNIDRVRFDLNNIYIYNTLLFFDFTYINYIGCFLPYLDIDQNGIVS